MGDARGGRVRAGEGIWWQIMSAESGQVAILFVPSYKILACAQLKILYLLLTLSLLLSLGPSQ